MKTTTHSRLAGIAFLIGLLMIVAPGSLHLSSLVGADEEDVDADSKAPAIDPTENLPTTADEARGRARWLHEAFHGALQVMHRDFFGDGEEDLNLPSKSLEDVFLALAESWSVEIRWLGVNATKSVKHEPDDAFEKAAAKALAAGDAEYEAVERGKFRYVGAIQIRNECLKCHVPNRTSLQDRVGGLAITIPLKKEKAAEPAAPAPSSEQASATPSE